jgi:Zn-dependent protease
VALTEKYTGVPLEPIFAVLSCDAVPRKTDALGVTFTELGVVAILIATSVFATDVNSLNTDFLRRALAGDTSVAGRLVMVTGGVLALQLLHDLGHWVMAGMHGARLELPIALPSLQIRCFGTVTRFSSFVRSRKALFDIALAGPCVGLLASLAAFLHGLELTASGTAADLTGYPALPVSFFRASFLLHEAANNYLGVDARAAIDSALLVPVHPLVAIGAAGLLANALNMMPIGRLDGGRVAMAVGGRQAATGVTNACLVGLAVSFFAQPNPVLRFWSVFVVLFQRGLDLPPEDDVTPSLPTTKTL